MFKNKNRKKEKKKKKKAVRSEIYFYDNTN